MLKRYEKNTAARDIAVGDIHGCFSKLQCELDRIGFDTKADRLFSVGDLVDRGPESEATIRWLNYDWFHPVRGNHDDYVARHETCDRMNWLQNGGGWFMSLSTQEQQNFGALFADLPLAIQVETDSGLIGIVHADPCVFDWSEIESFMSNRIGRNSLMWSRKRMESDDDSVVSGVRAVVVGHTPLPSGPIKLGNVLHIDTAGWHKSGRFTLLDLATLEVL